MEARFICSLYNTYHKKLLHVIFLNSSSFQEFLPNCALSGGLKNRSLLISIFFFKKLEYSVRVEGGYKILNMIWKGLNKYTNKILKGVPQFASQSGLMPLFAISILRLDSTGKIIVV